MLRSLVLAMAGKGLQMSADDKPREWTSEEIYWTVERCEDDFDRVFVEYSAYEAERAKLAALEARAQGLVEALKQISGDHPKFVCDDQVDCEFTAMGALAEFEKDRA